MKRNGTIAARFKKGWTTPRLANYYGVSPQRIQQILKRYDLGYGDGGVSVRAGKTRDRAQAERERARERRYRKYYGCSYAEYVQINGPGEKSATAKKYIEQRHAAQQRGIKWALPFPVWWSLWKRSGKWKQRGKYGYCLTRKNFRKGFTPDNVYITTFSKASSKARLQDWHG